MNNQLPVHLFQKKRFQMHAGGFSDFKVECDALTEADYQTLAFLIARKFTFGKVWGIPRGGKLLGQLLQQYVTPESTIFLLVDDVLTTGKSMIDAKEQLSQQYGDQYEFQGVVVFSRGEPHSWIQPIFQLAPCFWQND